MEQQKQAQTLSQSIPNETILVVKRRDLIGEVGWQGLKTENLEVFLSRINDHKEFLPRPAMEEDPSYKQIIPYLIFECDGKYFLMERKKKASETRLASKFSLGIGGHIRHDDMETDSIFDWSRREFYEEVSYEGELEIEPLGILNDDSNEVGRVHIGFVFLLKGNSDKISIKDEHADGTLLTIDELKSFYDRMENWSKIVFDAILQKS